MNNIAKREQFLPAQDDPEAQLEWAQRAASALMKRVEAKKRKVIISGKQYLEFGDWQTLGSFFSATVGTDWSRPIIRDGALIGYEARAAVYRNGQVVSSAEAQCLSREKNWGNRDEFALRSMAQTRACAKALRNAFGWVAELAGYASTPAEEMEKSTRETKLVNAGKRDYPAPQEQRPPEVGVPFEDRARAMAQKGETAFTRWYVNLDTGEKKRLTNISEELRGLMNEADEKTGVKL